MNVTLLHVAYHEAFWVVTGTAAPVIAVALTVSISDSQSIFSRLIEDLKRSARQAVDDRDSVRLR